MSERNRDRRRAQGGTKLRPRSSPANVLVLTVMGVLAATAAAAALFGTGLEETTPHGQVLTSLQRVADAQEEHHRENGTFARWIQSLEMEAFQDVRVDLIRGDESGWEAIAGHSVGLSCVQSGTVRPNGSMLRDQPICYTTD